MDDQRVGSTIRAVRMRRGWRQVDLATAAGVSASLVSRLERGRLGNVPLDTTRRVLAALDVRLDLLPRWRGGELDRLLNAKHSALHEDVARWLARRYPTWLVAPEVSFSIYGERGIVDMLAWHPARRALIVIELRPTSSMSTSCSVRSTGSGVSRAGSPRSAAGVPKSWPAH